MKNIKQIIIFFVAIFLVSACGTIRKGFEADKRTGEEFLVEKKSPLVMPPSYNELPIPKEEINGEENIKSDIKSILLGSREQEPSNTNNDSISSIEKLILKKIKKN